MRTEMKWSFTREHACSLSLPITFFLYTLNISFVIYFSFFLHCTINIHLYQVYIFVSFLAQIEI